MVIPRSFGFRTAARSSRCHSLPTAARSPFPKRLGSRGYASGGHETKKASGDLPWLIGSIAVTVPTCFYLLQQTPARGLGNSHGDDHGAEHGEGEHEDGTQEGDAQEREGGDDQDEKEGGDEGDESSGGGSEQQPDSKNAADSNEGEDAPNNDEESKESSDDSASEGEDDQAQDTPDTSDDESSGGKGSDSGVRFKGPVKGGPKEHNINRYPDAKGGTKKRLESTYGRKQGQAEEDPNEAPGNDRGGSTSKTPVKGSQSGKQEGVSNTDTKHSYDLDNDNSRSRKPEGPETAKTKGTIDPSRPQV